MPKTSAPKPDPPKPAPKPFVPKDDDDGELAGLALGHGPETALRAMAMRGADYARDVDAMLEAGEGAFPPEENTFAQDFGALEEDDEVNDETFGDMSAPVGLGTLEELSVNTQARLGDVNIPATAGPVGKQSHAPAPQQPMLGPDSSSTSLSSGLGGLGSADASAPLAPRPPPAPPVNQVIDRDKRSHANALRMLQASLKTLPRPHDCERPKPYVPPNPHRTPSYYPQTPHPAFNNPEIFSRFNTDTLYFIFYYQQATYQQYLAAKELKKQSWRYHKKYLTWFQRHDQPKVTTDEYEQGTYIYFDYETGWCQRIKQEFVFKYAYLEDELQI